METKVLASGNKKIFELAPPLLSKDTLPSEAWLTSYCRKLVLKISPLPVLYFNNYAFTSELCRDTFDLF